MTTISDERCDEIEREAERAWGEARTFHPTSMARAIRAAYAEGYRAGAAERDAQFHSEASIGPIGFATWEEYRKANPAREDWYAAKALHSDNIIRSLVARIERDALPVAADDAALTDDMVGLAQRAISDLAQIYGLIQEGRYEEAEDYCRGAADSYSQEIES